MPELSASGRVREERNTRLANREGTHGRWRSEPTREAAREGPAPSTTRLIKRNPIADSILNELLIFFPEELAVRLLSQKCAEQGVIPEALRPSDVTADF